MYSLNQLKTLVSCGRDPARSLPFRRGFLLIPLILICFAFSPQMQAVSPAPDGGYAGGNTAEGTNALLSLIAGVFNTGVGFDSLLLDTSGQFNTGVGADATQTFTLTVKQAPTFTSPATATFVEKTGGSFTVIASAYPTATLSESATDTVPNGVTFNPATGVLTVTGVLACSLY